jgi:glyoxylase-like metal-dependent hydrolase (beta-lactamase superfamily II)
MNQIGMREPGFIMPTHIHIDHGGAIGSLARLFPTAQVFVHPRGAKHAIDPTRLIESTKMAFGNDYEDRYGPLIPVSESQMVIPDDGDVISIDGRELQILHAPGHAPHHIAIFDRTTAGLFSGESLGVPRDGTESSPLPTAAPPGFDLEDYLETIEKLRQLHPRILFFSHDGTGKNPEELIAKVAENTKEFGDIILQGLKRGETIETINSRLKEYTTNHFDKDMGDLGIMTARGYIHYFQKKGLV